MKHRAGDVGQGFVRRRFFAPSRETIFPAEPASYAARMTKPKTTLPIAALALLATGCATASQAPALSEPQDRFWQALASHCGMAYEGALASEDARDTDWRGRAMVAHWAECSDTRIAIAFHVEEADGSGWDRSRTWLVTRTEDGLRLKHDHRHEDGSADAVTMYGGDTAGAGSARAQNFPVHAESIVLFEREGLDASLTNVWRIEVDPAGEPNATFAYQLTRRNDPTRLFRAEFDASEEVAPPPAASALTSLSKQEYGLPLTVKTDLPPSTLEKSNST